MDRDKQIEIEKRLEKAVQKMSTFFILAHSDDDDDDSIVCVEYSYTEDELNTRFKEILANKRRLVPDIVPQYLKNYKALVVQGEDYIKISSKSKKCNLTDFSKLWRDYKNILEELYLFDNKIKKYTTKETHVMLLYPAFEKHYKILLDNEYITKKDDFLKWEKSKNLLALYFASLGTPAHWREIEILFSVKSLKNSYTPDTTSKIEKKKLENLLNCTL